MSVSLISVVGELGEYKELGEFMVGIIRECIVLEFPGALITRIIRSVEFPGASKTRTTLGFLGASDQNTPLEFPSAAN